MASNIARATPTATIRAFLDCVRRKDGTSMRKLCHPNATAVLIRHDEPRFQTLNEAIERLEQTPQQLVEETWDEIEHVDGQYATVWTNFSIHMEGKASLALW